MNGTSGAIALVALFSGLFSMAQQPRADLKDGADVFPDSTGIYVELRQPADLLKAVVGHPLGGKIQGLEAIRTMVPEAQLKMGRGLLAFVELQLGSKWPVAFDRLAGHGMYLGADPHYEGVALLVHAKHPVTLLKARDLFVEAARDKARKEGRADPVQTDTYRSVDVFGIGQARFAVVGDWLVVTPKEKFGAALVDNLLGRGGKRLAGNTAFKQARQRAPSGVDAWSYVDLDAVREAGLAKELFRGGTNNPLGDLLFAGLFSSLPEADHLQASLDLRTEELRLQVELPHDPDAVPDSHAWFFPEDAGTTPAMAVPKDTLLTASLPRDFAGWWLSASDLYDERTQAKVLEADTNLSNLFGGQDFGGDILASAASDVQLVLTRQNFRAREVPVPAIKLPAFALVVPLKDGKVMSRRLKNTFNNFIGFINIVGAQEEKPQFELDMDLVGDGKIYTAAPMAMADMKMRKRAAAGGDAAGLAFNAAPTLGLLGDTAIISSSRELAEELMKAGHAAHPVPARPMTLEASGPVLSEVLADNREQLIVKAILEDGKDRETATRDIEVFLKALTWIKRFDVDVHRDKESMGVEVLVEFAP